MTSFSPVFAIPLISRASTGAPKSGAGWTSVRAIVSTSETPSASSPTIFATMLTTMTTANRVYSVGRMPSVTRRSTTGMICPRRIMTPWPAPERGPGPTRGSGPGRARRPSGGSEGKLMPPHQRAELLGVDGQGERRGGELLGLRGARLHQSVHLDDRLVDLLDPLRLLRTGGGDLGDDLGHALHRGDDLLEGLAGLIHERRAGPHLLHRIVDQRLDLFGGRGRPLRQISNLRGDDGEPAALLPGAGRLDGRVERQEVGLERDLVDAREDLRDPLGRSGDLAHRGARRGDDLAAPLGRVTRLHRELTGLARDTAERGGQVVASAVASMD